MIPVLKIHFLIHTEDRVIKFERTPEGLYVMKPTTKFLEHVAATKKTKMRAIQDGGPDSKVCNMVSTVSENELNFTPRQRKRALEARRLYHIIGCPTVENFKHILRQHIIKNCPVTVEDVTIAEQIYGMDIGTLKGKTTRHKPVPVTTDLIEVPPEIKEQHADITLCVDVMFVNGFPMFTSIDRTLKFRALVPLVNRTESELFRAIDMVFRHYNIGGFRIKSIHCDQEFKPIMDKVSDELGIEMNYATTDEHVPEAERNNRTIKERIRATYHNLPFKALPKVMLQYLAMVCTDQLNLFPAKGGVSAYYSPLVILTGRPYDFWKHCQVPFGAYVQASNEPQPTNTNAPRTIDCIYLRPTRNKQGGHELMDLMSGRVITRPRVVEIPMTDRVIKTVEAMAFQQGIKSLKFSDRYANLIDTANPIAGVDDEAEDDDAYEYGDDEEPKADDELAERMYDRVDQSEIDDLLADSGQTNRDLGQLRNETNPTVGDEIQEADARDDETPDFETESEITEDSTRRSERVRSKPERYGFSQKKKNVVHKTTMKFTDEDKIFEMKGYTRVHFPDDMRDELESKHNLFVDDRVDVPQIEYTETSAVYAARFISEVNSRVQQSGSSFAQQYNLRKGLSKFGSKGEEAAMKELDQLHARNCFAPISVADLTRIERSHSVDALMLLSEKKGGTIKGWMVYTVSLHVNGYPVKMLPVRQFR